MPGIHEAIAAIVRETDAITKDRRNTQQGYQFRGIDDVYNAIHPLFARHGVFSVPTVTAERTEERTTKNGSALIYRVLTVKYTFYAADGSSIESVVMGEGMDSGDKASNKAMAVAHKYALMQLLAIPTDDVKDPEVDSHEVAPKAPAQSPDKKVLADIKAVFDRGAFSAEEIAFYRAEAKKCSADADRLSDLLADVLAAERAKKAAPKKLTPSDEAKADAGFAAPSGEDENIPLF